MLLRSFIGERVVEGFSYLSGQASVTPVCEPGDHGSLQVSRVGFI